MSYPPPTNTEIDAWVDAYFLPGVINVTPEYLDWGIPMPRVWVVAYTRNDGTKQYQTTKNDPTVTADGTREWFEGFANSYQVNIRAYDNFFSIPPKPAASSLAVSDAEQATYNDPTQWAPAS